MISRETIAALESEASDLAGREQWSEAARELLRAAKAQPQNAERWLQIANWQRKSGDAPAAAQTLETALKLNSRRKSAPLQEDDAVSLWLALAEAHLEAQNWSACTSACEVLLQLAPQHHFALEMLATSLLQGGEPAAAEVVMRELLQMSPRDVLHRLRLATLLQLQGKLGDATREFERVLQMHLDIPVEEEAGEALETLERMQMQQILILASERLDFRRQLELDMDSALETLNFYLSEGGRESLQNAIWDGSFAEEDGTPVIH